MLVDTATATTASASTSSLSQLGEDYTRFIKLLTAQISYQDPLAPMDSTQFVSQLAQLSQVEQAVKTNSNLESLSAQLGALTAVTGMDMIGRTVTVTSSRAELANGKTSNFYELPVGATTVSAEIRDPLGQVVRTISGLPGTAETRHALGWDGTDDLGQPVLEGQYSVTYSAADAEGKALAAYSFRRAPVQEVMFSGGQLMFGLSGGETISADQILGAS